MADFQESLAEARGGDRSAADRLLEPWLPLLRLQAARLLGDQMAARVAPSDIVQDCLSQAFQDLDAFRGENEAQFGAWLRSLLAGHAAKTWRGHTAQRRSVRREVPLTEQRLAGDGERPSEQIMHKEEAARVARALERLPEPMRTAVVQRVLSRRPWEEISHDLGISPGAARVLWTRAVQRLRTILDETTC